MKDGYDIAIDRIRAGQESMINGPLAMSGRKALVDLLLHPYRHRENLDVYESIAEMFEQSAELQRAIYEKAISAMSIMATEDTNQTREQINAARALLESEG